MYKPDRHYLELLAQEFPNKQSAFTEIINLQAILNLPKGTEHFVSDVHGEYGAFNHILNNASGVIRDKIQTLYPMLAKRKCNDICTLIYYPDEVLKRKKQMGENTEYWYRDTITLLLEIATFLSANYTRSKVRRAMNTTFAYIIDELMNVRADESDKRAHYHECILDSIIHTQSTDYFIKALASLIKRLAVDQLHVLGDLYDRGSHADKVVDVLMDYHNIDIQWGNHDALWMGAACGSAACVTTAVRINVKYGAYHFLENGYGISLRKLALFADKTYKDEPGMKAIFKAISIINLKLQGQTIKRHPEWNMDHRLLLPFVDVKANTVTVNGISYPLTTQDLPTIDPAEPYKLTPEEAEVADDLINSFLNSKRLQTHVAFLYHKGAMYKACNNNLLYHGCVPMNEDGTLREIECDGKLLHGRAYFDYCDKRAREAWSKRTEKDLDFMWYLWCGELSPLSGRIIKTLERVLTKDKSAWKEPRNPYYDQYYNEDVCRMILAEFGVDPDSGHIINGHTPIKVKDGESPIRANGKLLVIDGGFCTAYQKTTGIAGYTLVYSSYNMRLKAHTPFTGKAQVLEENHDMLSNVLLVEKFAKRRMVADTDDGAKIKQTIINLQALLEAYHNDELREPSPMRSH